MRHQHMVARPVNRVRPTCRTRGLHRPQQKFGARRAREGERDAYDSRREVRGADSPDGLAGTGNREGRGPGPRSGRRGQPLRLEGRGWALEGERKHRFPLVLGFDAAGVVERVGAGVTELAEGDEVYGYLFKPVVGGGAYAEYASA